MALTMTRTRNQTTLTSLANLLANVNGELEFVEESLRTCASHSSLFLKLESRRTALLSSRKSLFLAIKQFDPELDPTLIGTKADWLKPFGRGQISRRRYFHSLSD